MKTKLAVLSAIASLTMGVSASRAEVIKVDLSGLINGAFTFNDTSATAYDEYHSATFLNVVGEVAGQAVTFSPVVFFNPNAEEATDLSLSYALNGGTYSTILFGPQLFADSSTGPVFSAGDDNAYEYLFGPLGPTGFAQGLEKISISAVSAVSPAPEPSTWALMIAGVGIVGMALRYTKRRPKAELETSAVSA